MKRSLFLGCLLISGLWLWTAVRAGAGAQSAPPPKTMDPAEVLEAAPADAPLTPSKAAEDKALQNINPGSGPTPAPTPREKTAKTAFGPADIRILLPYYFAAYVPPVDRTELNLGIFLSATPGIDVSLGWGATERLMLSAKISAFGASSTVGLNARYLVSPELPESSNPAVSLILQGLFLDHKTLGDVKENIFGGNRIQVGAVFSKDLGSLAGSLDANQDSRKFLGHFRLHAEALAEIQNGLLGAAQDPVSRLNAGIKVSLESILDPNQLYAYVVFDTIPDWLGEENYYLGLRYFSQPDLAFDALVGRIQNGYGLALAVAWIF